MHHGQVVTSCPVCAHESAMAAANRCRALSHRRVPVAAAGFFAGVMTTSAAHSLSLVRGCFGVMQARPLQEDCTQPLSFSCSMFCVSAFVNSCSCCRFFHREKDYEREAAVYGDPTLRSLLPQVRLIYCGIVSNSCRWMLLVRASIYGDPTLRAPFCPVRAPFVLQHLCLCFFVCCLGGRPTRPACRSFMVQERFATFVLACSSWPVCVLAACMPGVAEPNLCTVLPEACAFKRSASLPGVCWNGAMLVAQHAPIPSSAVPPLTHNMLQACAITSTPSSKLAAVIAPGGRHTLDRVQVVRSCDNRNGRVQSRSGWPFPPFIVLERGTSLRGARNAHSSIACIYWQLLHYCVALQVLLHPGWLALQGCPHCAGLCSLVAMSGKQTVPIGSQP